MVVERDHCGKKKAHRVDFAVERGKRKIKKAQQKIRPPHVKSEGDVLFAQIYFSVRGVLL